MRMLIPWVILVAAFAPASAKPRNQITVVARVSEIPNGLGACGVIAVTAVIKLDVVEVKSGQYASRELFLVVMCPEGYAVGQTYRLVLTPVGNRARFIDEFPTGQTRYRATVIKRLRK